MIDISVVAKRSGLPASTLRFYEEKGLIASVARRSRRRFFGTDVFDRLALIALGRTAGFSLDEIATMLALGGARQIDRNALEARAAEIDSTIARLSAISTALKHAAACPAPNHMECPTFRGYLDLAAAGLVSAPPPRAPCPGPPYH
ncbi:helix-turn-helix domain-containing protein [Mycobacterium sp. SMC-4]|uniref:helix-turn-helix domain-containing protein n=1 Tax=Mycobacterium sp. SMC-4 TaxID=2857059 RepID=UPI0021B47962|nr:helix-turn-helix domain-containing protein [Mycobacterium sp. SMC-4]UXA16966.1 helix-turn-helix domain-containing protein [Mycobacterium sp. SMC-4]